VTLLGVILAVKMSPSTHIRAWAEFGYSNLMNNTFLPLATNVVPVSTVYLQGSANTQAHSTSSFKHTLTINESSAFSTKSQTAKRHLLQHIHEINVLSDSTTKSLTALTGRKICPILRLIERLSTTVRQMVTIKQTIYDLPAGHIKLRIPSSL
jgi:hypothetical protein